MSVAKNLALVRASIPAAVNLVAVSKTHPPETVLEAWRAGQRDFGENRPQEMAAKRAALSALDPGTSDIRWHQIGHLQTNKVKLIAPFVAMIHSVDSARLAEAISRQAATLGRTIDVLLEIRIGSEASKEGWEWDELAEWLSKGEWRTLAGIRFRGVMGIATFTSDEAVVRAEFENLARMFAELRERFFSPADLPRGAPPGGGFDVISMGMSDDYPLALAAGSNLLRIGSAIFGARRNR
jgi:pyridoxal phosphate enzyme (YggS family)